jgi:hypothetical protein
MKARVPLGTTERFRFDASTFRRMQSPVRFIGSAAEWFSVLSFLSGLIAASQSWGSKDRPKNNV